MITSEDVASIAELEMSADAPPVAAKPAKSWTPDLNPTQAKIFHDPAPFILAYGEKGSGKSIGCEHKLVRHCYENWDALGLIVTPSIRTGKFGVIHDLETLILPAWEDGIGLEWYPSKLDPNTKDRILKIRNRFDGLSTVLQISIPHEEFIGSRVKGIHPSMAFCDELTDCKGDKYFSLIAAQLNRRRHITGPQQYIAACNPEGPSNWVYKTFIENTINLTTGKRDPSFSVYHVPFRENSHRPEMAGYLEKLERAVAGDPVEKERLIDGKWVDRQTGLSLFKGYYSPDRHVKGSVSSGTGIVPIKGFPCVIGYDLGQVYSAAVFMQMIPTPAGMTWIVFDEVVYLRKKILYRDMAREIIDRMSLWDMSVYGTSGKFAWEHIADDSAVNQWRPGSGSYDAWDFEREFHKASLERGDLGTSMRMVGCPKGSGSVETRVRLTQAILHQDRLFISAGGCPHVCEMLRAIEGKKDNPMAPAKTVSGHIHVFDAMTYPILKMEMGGSSILSGPPISSVTIRR